MNQEKSEFHRDLAKKLGRLDVMRQQPELFIVDHFTSIRNEIDLDAERLIYHLASKNTSESAAEIEEANSTRSGFIDFLDKIEASLYAKLHEIPVLFSPNDLEKRVDAFVASLESMSVNEMEEAYLQLALDIIDETNEAESRILHNQTVAYLSRSIGDQISKMGNLVFLSEDYLNRDELSCLKFYDESIGPTSRFVYERFRDSLSSSLVVPASRPFIFTKNTIIVVALLHDINQRQVAPSRIVLYPNDLRDLMKQQEVLAVLSRRFDVPIEAVRLPNLPAGFPEPTSIDLNDYRLRSFSIDDSLWPRLKKLDLSFNQLEAFDHQDEMLTKANSLESLRLIKALLPGTNFSLGFLSALKNLSQLELTLPDVPVDFGVFGELEKLQSLRLQSAASQDSSIERPKLTEEHLKQISAALRLCNLELSHFEMELFNSQVLGKFSNLFSLILENNKISCVEEMGMGCCVEFFSCYFLNLSNNLIEQLPPGFCARLRGLKHLFLDYNLIRRIERGVFKKLPQLKILKLNNNLIEAIEAGAFEALSELTRLSLKNCRLRTIESRALRGLISLETLSFDYNQIEDFRVTTESGETVIGDMLRPGEYELVKENLFSSMWKLTSLSLRGNKLEKIDLNCFCNLTSLHRLDLSHNLIGQINEEIRPGVLCKLFILDLSENRLDKIDPRSFSTSIRLIELNLAGNKLEKLAENFFEPFSELRSLSLQRNSLSMVINAKTFRSQIRSLAQINLLDNTRVCIEEGALNDLVELNEIRIEFRHADSLTSVRFIETAEDAEWFSKLTNFSMVNCSIESFEMFKTERFSILTELDLSRNLIRVITKDSFAVLSNLNRLNIAGNLIETLDDSDVFEVLPKLQHLNLSGNKLKHVHRRIFMGLNKLESLDLSNNPGLLNIDSGVFRGLFSLKQLNLEGNNIGFFDLSLLFRSCCQLECIDLSNNQLDHESINEASMSGSTSQNLKQLILANNRLERMDFVRELYRLEKLDLRGNKIESVISDGVNLLSKIVNLKHVNLSNNQIKSLDIKSIFSHLRIGLELIDVSNNPFNI